MMHFSRRWLRLGLVPAMVALTGACGFSGESDESGGSVAGGATAVSATPQTREGASTQPRKPSRQGTTSDTGADSENSETTASSRPSKGANSKVDPVIRPGVESPMDSANDSISKHLGTLLFATGFEEGVSIDGPLASRDAFQHLSGSDIPGFSFPVGSMTGDSGWYGLIHAEVGTATPMPASEYAGASIKVIAGRKGPTRALSLHSKAQSPRTHAQAIAVKSFGFEQEPVGFQRMWMKFDPNTLTRARQVGASRFYQTFWEVRARPDFRLQLKLHHDDAQGLVWVAEAGGVKAEESGQSSWAARLNSVPVVLAAETSAAGWHKVEIWLDRSGGRFKVAIDGQTLVDRGGPLMGTSGNRIDDYRMMMVSSTVAPLAEVLFDDVEFWSLPPGDAWAVPD